jgi:hypothetical protein
LSSRDGQQPPEEENRQTIVKSIGGGNGRKNPSPYKKSKTIKQSPMHEFGSPMKKKTKTVVYGNFGDKINEESRNHELSDALPGDSVIDENGNYIKYTSQ